MPGTTVNALWHQPVPVTVVYRWGEIRQMSKTTRVSQTGHGARHSSLLRHTETSSLATSAAVLEALFQEYLQSMVKSAVNAAAEGHPAGRQLTER